jgi:hypothetical protein
MHDLDPNRLLGRLACCWCCDFSIVASAGLFRPAVVAISRLARRRPWCMTAVAISRSSLAGPVHDLLSVQTLEKH